MISDHTFLDCSFLTVDSWQLPSIDCYDTEKVRVCGQQEFRCDSSKCIPLSWQCDGEIDCPGGLDEWEEICSEFVISILGHDLISILQRSIKKRTATSESLNVNQMEPVSQRSGGRR